MYSGKTNSEMREGGEMERERALLWAVEYGGSSRGLYLEEVVLV